MSRVKNAALLMQKLFTTMGMLIALPVIPISTPMKNYNNYRTSWNPESVTLDYYDQRCENEYYCEETLYAFGSEAYQQILVNDTRSTLMETN